MKVENEQFLIDHLYIFRNWERNQEIKTTAFIRDEMLRVMREEFNSSYHFCGGCPHDLRILLHNLYVYYHNWLKAEKQDTRIFKDITEGIEEMNKIIVHANFPKHDTI